MENQAEKRILNALEKHKGCFAVLRHLAIESGFKGVSDKKFKDAFNNLSAQGLLKLSSAGWALSIVSNNELHEYSENDKDIQVYWERYPCVDCPEAKTGQNVILCSKYGWEVAIELAKTQELCAF